MKKRISSNRTTAKKRAPVRTALCVWLLLTIVLYAIAVATYPVDSQNTLILPNWYEMLLLFFPLLCGTLVFIAVRFLNTPKPQWDVPRDYTDLFNDAVRIVTEDGEANPIILQRKLRIRYGTVAKLIDDMEERGIVGPYEGQLARKVLVSYSVAKSLTASDAERAKPFQTIVFSEQSGLDAEMLTVDSMGGHEFEHYCADILRRIGFVNVEVTQGSGDQGVDVLAEKDGIRYAIQCKCYSSDLGNKPVQEVNAGKVIYKCHIGVVITNRYFTAGGKQAADATGVLLWDRDKLKTFIQQAKNISEVPI